MIGVDANRGLGKLVLRTETKSAGPVEPRAHLTPHALGEGALAST